MSIYGLHQSALGRFFYWSLHGYRNRLAWTCADNELWQFISVVRVADLVNESIEEAFLAFNDRPQTLAQLDLMVMSGRNTLKRLENEGVLLPGSDFWLLDGQTADDGVQGILKFGMKFEPPAPAVDIRILSSQWRSLPSFTLPPISAARPVMVIWCSNICTETSSTVRSRTRFADRPATGCHRSASVPPPDTKIIGETWRYPNRGGGPAHSAPPSTPPARPCSEGSSQRSQVG